VTQLKRTLIAIAITTLTVLSGCSTPYSHQSLAVNLRPRGTRIHITETGSARILGMFPTGKDPDANQVLNDLRELNGCKTLANINLDHYTKHYLLWSKTILNVHADCVQ